jgi:uncharacterized protein (TIGR00251 family)
MMVRVKVKTNQHSFSVKKGNVWVIGIKSSPEKGMANREIIRELSKNYGSVRIISGFKSRNKVLELKRPAPASVL